MNNKKYFLFDTEFCNFDSLAPLSLGIISEDKEHEFYAEVSDYDLTLCSDFVRQVVLPLMKLEQYGKTLFELGQSLVHWINSLPCNEVVFVADYRGDMIILERILSQANLPQLKKQIIIQMIGSAFVQACQERGIREDLMYKAGDAFTQGVNEALAREPQLQHNACYDAHANREGWLNALDVVK